MNWYSLQIPAAISAVMVIAYGFARRGRRIDDHPLCRKCGFDQTGRPAESLRCSECGSDVTRRRAIRIGNRSPLRALSTITLLMLLVSVSWFGLVAYAQLRSVNWNIYKPMGWLVEETASGDAATRNAAFAELVRRVDQKLLTPESETALIETALARQADWNIPWLPDWGTIVETIDAKGRLSDGQRERYVVNSFELFAVTARPQTDHQSLVLLANRRLRLSASSAQGQELFQPCGLLYADPTVYIDGRPFKNEVDVAHTWAGQSGAYRADWLDMPKDPKLISICEIPTTPDNPTLEVTLDLDRLREGRVWEGRHLLQADLIFRPDPTESGGKPPAERRVSLQLPFDMPPPPADIDSSVSAEQVYSAITARVLQVGNRENRSNRVVVRIGVDRAPANLAFHASVFVEDTPFWVSAERRVLIQCRKGESIPAKDYEFVLYQPVAAGYAGSVKVEFMPDRLQRTLSPIWGYPVEFNLFHGVPRK